MGSHRDAHLGGPDFLVDRLAGREAILDVQAHGGLDEGPRLLFGLALGVAALKGRADREEPAVLVTLVAVLVSPVAWDHYYVLFFPAWLALLTARSPAGAGPLWWSAVLIAGTLTSGIVLAALPTWLRWELLLRSVDAWGALLLVLLLVLQRAREDSNLRPTA